MRGQNYLLGIGSVNVDVCGAITGAVRMHDSNPGDTAITVGGVTHNVAANFARMGGRAKLIACVGDDPYAALIEAGCRAEGIDIGHFLHIPGASSGTHICVMDDVGDVIVGVSSLGVHKNLTPEALQGKLDVMRGAQVISCDASLPAETLRYIAEEGKRQDVPVFVNPVSRHHARRLRGIIGGFHTVAANRGELGEMSGVAAEVDADVERAADALLRQGVRRVVVTLGKEGCLYKDSGGTTARKQFRPVDRMQSATGAGDAFIAGLLHGFVNGLGVEETLDIALAAGCIAVTSLLTIHPEMSLALVAETIARHKL